MNASPEEEAYKKFNDEYTAQRDEYNSQFLDGVDEAYGAPFDPELPPTEGFSLNDRSTIPNIESKLNSASWRPKVGEYGGSDFCAIAWQDGAVGIYNTRKGITVSLKMMENTADFLNKVSWSPDGKILAAGGANNTVTLYKTDGDPGTWDSDASKDSERTFQCHQGAIFDIQWLSNTVFLSASGDGTVMLWDTTTSTNKCVKEPNEIFRIIKGNETVGCNSIAIVDDNRFLVGASDARIYLFDKTLIKAGENNGLVATYVGHANVDEEEEKKETLAVTCVKMIPGCKAFGSVGEDATARLWDLDTHTEIGFVQRNHPLTALAFSSSGRYMFVGNQEGEIDVYDTLKLDKQNKVTDTLDDKHEGMITCLELSHDGMALASTSRSENQKKNLCIFTST
jgi:WD40 repeat protein